MNYATLHNTAPPPKTSRVLENPVTGERITFLATSAETEGRLHQHRLELPLGTSAARHLHTYQQKSLSVPFGRLRVWVNELEHLLGPGDSLVILPGQAHAWKTDDGVTALIVTLRPALDSEKLFETQIALAKEGKTNKRGLPKA